MTLTRRRFLTTATLAACAAPRLTFGATSTPEKLTIGTRVLEVNGKAANVYGITNATGGPGLVINQSDGFKVQLANRVTDPTVIHWHGLTPPANQDGNHLSQPLIGAASIYDYDFDLARAGTNWMHSHHGLQEQQMMAAPLIILGAQDQREDRQEIVMMLHDFTFTPPDEILDTLVHGDATHIGSGMSGMAGMNHGMMMDLNDVEYDAFLANDRTLDDPDVVAVSRGGNIRLRIINGATSTSFWIDLGALKASLVAVDGMDIIPVSGSVFELAMAQRLDLDITIPDTLGAFPILAQREGDTARTGIILATPGANLTKIPTRAATEAPAIGLALESQLNAKTPLPTKTPDRRLGLNLNGDMAAYAWGLNGVTYDNRIPLDVKTGERVEITMMNHTMMSHPMHLHGHHFQITALGRNRISGAMRDTVLVPPMQSVTIAFDANNPGEWPFHCHNLYHMAAGMMTTLRYT